MVALSLGGFLVDHQPVFPGNPISQDKLEIVAGESDTAFGRRVVRSTSQMDENGTSCSRYGGCTVVSGRDDDVV